MLDERILFSNIFFIAFDFIENLAPCKSFNGYEFVLMWFLDGGMNS